MFQRGDIIKCSVISPDADYEIVIKSNIYSACVSNGGVLWPNDIFCLITDIFRIASASGAS